MLALNGRLGRFATHYVKKRKLPLLECALTEVSFSGSSWCFHGNRGPTSHLFCVKKKLPVKCLAAKISYPSRTSCKREQSLKLKDQVPEDFRLVYNANLQNYVVIGRISAGFSIICLLGVAMKKVYYLWPREPMDVETMPKHTYPPDGVMVGDTDFLVYFSAMLMLVVALQSVLSQLPLRLYHNPDGDQYIAIFSNIIGYPSKFSFSKGDSKKLKASGFLPWKDSKFSLGSKEVILLENCFRLPSDYNALLGMETSDSSS